MIYDEYVVFTQKKISTLDSAVKHCNKLLVVDVLLAGRRGGVGVAVDLSTVNGVKRSLQSPPSCTRSASPIAQPPRPPVSSSPVPPSRKFKCASPAVSQNLAWKPCHPPSPDLGCSWLVK